MTSTIALDPAAFSLFLKLCLAMLCGLLLGTERVLSHKAAGMRTYALVSLGSALFIIIGDLVVNRYMMGNFNPAVIMSGIISGVGFMGAGVIIFRDSSLVGLTTASGLWVAAGIGIAAGFGLFTLALLATFFALFVFIVLWHLEQRIKKVSGIDDTGK